MAGGRHRGWWNQPPPGSLHKLVDGDVVCADALAALHALKDECADIVFLDPPFNLGKRYGARDPHRDRLPEDDYFHFMARVLARSTQVLKPGGALYFYHIPRWAVKFSTVLDGKLDFRHWIAVSMKNGFVAPKHLYPAHYALLYYTKGAPAAFHRPKVPLSTCPHCNELVHDYGGYRRYMKSGANLSDIWDDVSPVRHRKFKSRAANQLPLEIPSRAVEISGRPRGLLVDPFAGTGSALLAARRGHMRFVGCDLEPTFCRLMVSRLSDGRLHKTKVKSE